ncbi:MAG: DNA polymerase III subunit gamma/tau [Pseudomonadota bacterium]
MSNENQTQSGPQTQTGYVVLARKYRPQVFEDLIGQQAMVDTLRNAFTSGRIAQGYMLTGVRGVGKTTTARILARALNFEKAGTPEGPVADLPRDPADYGRHCAEIMESRHPDVIEMDAASNTGVDNIREIIESARYKPLIARYKVFIIDEVHMLSKGAFNALLKTLEEPPAHVKFIFATTEIRKVPVTVLSRCQRFDLRRVDVPELVTHFAGIVETEGAKAEDEALKLIARAAGGSVRDGLSILDQAIAFSKSNVYADGVRAMLGLADRGRIFDILGLIFSGKTAEALVSWDNLHNDGADPAQALSDLAEAVHIATRIKVVGAASAAETLSAEEVRRSEALASSLSMALLARAWQMLLKGMEEVQRAPEPRAAAEMVVIRLAYTADLPAPDEIIKTLGGPPNKTTATTKQTADVPKAGAHASQPTTSQAAAPSEPAPSSPPPPSQIPPTAQTAQTAQAGPASEAPAHDPPPWSSGDVPPLSAYDDAETGDEPDPTELDVALHGDTEPLPASFEDVLGLIGRRRDAKLKVMLEEHVSLVKFDAATRSIDLYLYKEAPRELPNDLREKLNEWTGMPWVVMLSKSPGQRRIAEVRRERNAAELEALKAVESVKQAMQAFPDAEIVSVTDYENDTPDEQLSGGNRNNEAG